MSLLKMLDQIGNDNFNEEQTDQLINRKKMLRKMGSYSKKMALSAIPLGTIAAFGSTPAKAQSQTTDVDILNYALTLEFLERNFYDQGVASGVIPSSDMTVYKQIQKHEQQHVAFLQAARGDKAISEDTYTYDYTAGGAFDPFNNYTQFQVIAMGFEDTGVRAYKGQAGNVSNKDYLQAALQIHSVEARHASEVRRLAAKNGIADTKGWIIGAGDKAPAPIQPVYGADSTYKVSEANTTQGGADISGLVSTQAATESFDEPIDMNAVTTFLTDNGFLVPNS